MKRHWVGLALAAALVLGTSPAWAQRGGRGGGPGAGGGLGLLAQASVQSELKLSDEQKSKVTAELEKQRGTFGNLQGLSREERQKKFAEVAQANNATIAAILKEDQLKRFKEIALQQRGAQAIGDPELADALGLSAEQKSKVNALQETVRGEMRSAFQAGQGGDRDENRKKFEALRKASDEKFLAILTPEQQAKFKALQGEAFKGEIRRPQPRGNRPGAARGKGKARSSAALPSSLTPSALNLLALVTLLAPVDHSDLVPEARTADKQDETQKPAASDADKAKAKKKGKHRGRQHARNHRRAPRGPAARHGRPQGRDAAWDRVARAVQARDRHHGPGHDGVRHYLSAMHRGHGWLRHAQIHKSWSDGERAPYGQGSHRRGHHGFARGHHGYARYAHHRSGAHRGFHGSYASRGRHHGCPVCAAHHHRHGSGHGYAHHRGPRPDAAGRYAHHFRGPGHHGHHAAHHRHGHHGSHHHAHYAHHRSHHGEHGFHGHHGHHGHHRLASWSRHHGSSHHGNRHHGSHHHSKRDHDKRANDKRDHEKKPEGDRKDGK